jgi:hypothetical protein
MNSKATIRTLTLTLFLALAACGGDDGNQPSEGNAFLTIVGDTTMFVDYRAQRILTVRYHDASDQPLSGEVTFELRGEPAGSALNATAGATSVDGLVEITLAAGDDDAAFEVEASARFAAPVSWNIAVGSPFNLVGTYELDSRFDMVSGLPGTAGDVVNEIIAMTDDINDPAEYLLDIVEDKAGFTIPGRPALDALANDLIKSHAPGFISAFIDLANDFGQVATKFGTDSTIRVSEASGAEGLLAAHTLRGFHFTIDSQTYAFTNADLGIEDVQVTGIDTGVDRDRVSLKEHAMPIQYGGFLALTLEDILVPMVDPNAITLFELLDNNVDCVGIGQAVYDAVNDAFGLTFPTASTYAGFCRTGLQEASKFVMDKLTELDGIDLHIAGDARLQETNGDRMVDNLTQGKWSGSIDYLGEAAALAADANVFTGARVQAED